MPQPTKSDNDSNLDEASSLPVSPTTKGSTNLNKDDTKGNQSKADKLNKAVDVGVASAGGSGGSGGAGSSAGNVAKGGAKVGGANKALDKLDKHAPDKNHHESEGDKYAKAAGKAGGAAIGAGTTGTAAGAQVGAKVGEQATKNGRWKYVAAAIIAPTVIVIAIPLFIIAYIINNPWDAVREVLTNSKLREFGLDVAEAFGRGALRTAIEAITYTGEVEYKGENTAIAATATNIPPGSTLERLSRIDWKKAQYQTLDKSNCGYKLKLKQVVNAEGKKRFVPESVINTRTNATIPLDQLADRPQATYCIQKQYPIFNLMARQPVTREINQMADVHLSYASKKDTEEFNGDYKDVDKYVYDKTLDRITPNKDETIDFTPYQAQLDIIRDSYRDAVKAYNAANPGDQIKYKDDKANLITGIDKMYEDMGEGKSPYSMQLENYINIPERDTGQSALVTTGLANTMCPFVFGFLDIGNPDNEIAAKNARAAIESRLGSTERGAIKINTLADTRKADQLSNVENNNTIRQEDNWASSTAYQLDVYNQLRGVEQNPEATSTRSYNAIQSELYADPSIVLMKVGCIFAGAPNGVLQDSSGTILSAGYRLLKEKIVAQSEGVFDSTTDFGLKEIITSFVRTGSVTAVSGLEDGSSNYNRQATGFRQLMNDYYLRIGGRFLTAEEARDVAIQSEDTRRQEEKQGGIAYRLFDSSNIRSARSIISQNTISPKTAMTATGGILKQLINPLRSLADIHSSALYYTTGEHNRAFAANIDGDKYLKVDTAGVPVQDLNLNMLENSQIIENIKTSGSDSDKLKLAHYDACFKLKIPTQQYFEIATVRNIQFFIFFPEKQRDLTKPDEPDSEFNKFLDCKIILQDAKDFSNPAHQLPIRYRVYTYYNTLLDQMVSLSSDEDNQSIYASSDTGSTGGVVGPTDPDADTSNIPCPNEPGITPDKVYQTYGPGQVPANKIMVCFVEADGAPISINVSLASNLNKLVKDARAAGINFGGGGFRSYERQVELRGINGCPDIFTAPASSCRTPTAIPGTSNHEKGLAIDFTTGGSTISSGSSGFNWLVANASKYGLKNLPSESWHWSVTGG